MQSASSSRPPLPSCKTRTYWKVGGGLRLLVVVLVPTLSALSAALISIGSRSEWVALPSTFMPSIQTQAGFGTVARWRARGLPSTVGGVQLGRCGQRRSVCQNAFSDTVEEASEGDVETAVRAGGAVVLDVYAVWCGPCKLLEPVVEAFGDHLQKYAKSDSWGSAPKPRVLRMDSDAYPSKSSQLRVEGLPTVIFFNGGKETARLEGAVMLDEFESVAAAALGLEDFQQQSMGTSEHFETMEELELAVQMEDRLVLGVLVGTSEDSMQLQSALQLLPGNLRAQPLARVVTVDAEALPQVVEFVGIGDLPAIVLYEGGNQVAQLQGKALAASGAGEIAAMVNTVLK